MNIYCVKGVAAYHEFLCACVQCVLLALSTGGAICGLTAYPVGISCLSLWELAFSYKQGKYVAMKNELFIFSSKKFTAFLKMSALLSARLCYYSVKISKLLVV
jgi:hypothetical protein